MEKVKFSKPAFNVDKQFELLKSRGLIINDIEFAKSILSNITYYRLSAYMKYFQIDDNFKTGTTFEDVINLYNFDKEVMGASLNVTIQDKKVKMVFKQPFATIEKLIKLAKKEIAEVGMPAFKSAIISSKDECLESIKKAPKGADFNGSNCFNWWYRPSDVGTFYKQLKRKNRPRIIC